MHLRRTVVLTALSAGAVVVGPPGCFSGPSTGDNGFTSVAHLAGCAVDGGGAPHVAPNGYYTNGASVCTADGQAHLFHGVDRPSLEWSPTGDNLSAADFALMAGWNANVVRVALNQDFWLSTAGLHDGDYEFHVDQVVHWAEAAGLDVILDLHWSDRGDLTASTLGTQGSGSAQQLMADVNSITFWTQVATKYKGDGRVIFELYNEPHGVDASVWLNGGTGAGFPAAGMQQLYDAVRQTGAENLVIAGGLNWSYTFSSLPLLNGYNVMYATHPYNKSDNQPADWEGAFGFLASSDRAPVIATEFGDFKPACTGDWDQKVVDFADRHTMSWTAWAWYPKDATGCSFPSIIVDWSGTPSVQGEVIRAALHKDPAVTPLPTVGADAAAEGGDGAVASDAAAPATTDGSSDGSTSAAGDSSFDGGAPDASPD